MKAGLLAIALLLSACSPLGSAIDSGSPPDGAAPLADAARPADAAPRDLAGAPPDLVVPEQPDMMHSTNDMGRACFTGAQGPCTTSADCCPMNEPGDPIEDGSTDIIAYCDPTMMGCVVEWQWRAPQCTGSQVRHGTWYPNGSVSLTNCM